MTVGLNQEIVIIYQLSTLYRMVCSEMSTLITKRMHILRLRFCVETICWLLSLHSMKYGPACFFFLLVSPCEVETATYSEAFALNCSLCA
uniref:Uncharacterized protein n=1 Tax=Aegilops tauschii subsp. strangulata TaxID=200361 RepID=A0A453J512_AEGTS